MKIATVLTGSLVLLVLAILVQGTGRANGDTFVSTKAGTVAMGPGTRASTREVDYVEVDIDRNSWTLTILQKGGGQLVYGDGGPGFAATFPRR